MSRKMKTDERFHVLVVDDHASAREAVADVLRQAGYEVATCASATEALARLAKQQFERRRDRPADAGHERPGIHPRDRTSTIAASKC